MSTSIYEVAARCTQARARIQEHIYLTPLIPARSIGKQQDNNVLFKAENFQITSSFKVRGAMSKLSAHTGSQPLITASSGNHGIGSAYAAKVLNKAITIVLPETVATAKLEKLKSYGVKIVLHGAESGLAEQHAQKLAKDEGYTYVSPYNDLDIIAGQGAIGLELLEQCKQIDNIFISMGGGGLISGVGSVLKAFSPNVRISGVSAINSKALAASIAAGRVVETEHLATLAEGVAGGIDEDTVTLPIATAVVDRFIDCDEDDIKSAMRRMALEENMIVEGSAALALAGYEKVASELKGQRSIILLCGGNVDQKALGEIIYGERAVKLN